MANRLMSMNHHTSEYGFNVLQNYHKHRPLADIENEFNIFLEEDPFEYKKIINRPETTTTTYKSDNEDDELIKRAIKSAPLQRSNRKHKKNKFHSKSDVLNRSDSIKKGVKKKKRCKSTIDSEAKEDSNFGFLLLSMDEVGYSERKKKLNNQIHDLLKKDSAQMPHPAKSSNRDLNSESHQQWIPIVSDASSAFKSNSSNTLIDTFTSASKEKNSDNIYHVSSDIGSIIAQKLETGVKLYICRNGELVNNQPEKRNIDSKDSNRAALEELMDNMKVPLPTPLSWQDQILKSEGKIRGPRKHEVKIVEKPIHERKLFVKKLVDEEEFRPKLKHELDKQFLIAHTTKPKVDPFIVNTTRSNIKTKNAKVTSVEIVGVKQQIKPANVSLTIDEESEEILSEKQYNQIIENLTKQYTTRKKTQIDSKLTTKEQKDLADQEYVTELLNRYPPPPPPPTTTAKERVVNPPPPPPSTSNCTTPIRVNLHLLANDYVISTENTNRKKQTNYNVNKAYSQVYAQNNNIQKPSTLRSRPNSPNTQSNLSIILTKKNSNNDLIAEKSSVITKHTLNQQQSSNVSRSNTQASIVKINPISNAIKTAKTKNSRDYNSVEPMFIHIASSIEPIMKPDYLNYQNVRQQIQDPYDRKNSSLHNPSMVNSSFNDTTPLHSRLY